MKIAVIGGSGLIRYSVSERTFAPGDDALLSDTDFETWITQPATKSVAGTH